MNNRLILKGIRTYLITTTSDFNVNGIFALYKYQFFLQVRFSEILFGRVGLFV